MGQGDSPDQASAGYATSPKQLFFYTIWGNWKWDLITNGEFRKGVTGEGEGKGPFQLHQMFLWLLSEMNILFVIVVT